MPSFAAQDSVEELILSVQAGRHALSPGILAYESGGGYYLPVLGLAAVFEFHAEPGPDRKSVSGWALQEKQVFSIDLTGNDIQALAQPGIDADDFYIGLDHLNRVWPVTMTVDKSAMVLNVAVQGNLPFAQRAERKNRQALLEKRRSRKNTDKKLTEQPNPYRIYGLPVLDLETTQFYDEAQGGFGGRLAVTGVQDLLGMSANYAAIIRHDSGQFERPETLRLRFDRDAMGEQDLPFGLKHIELGDTRLRHAPLIKNNTGGRGFLLSSARQKRDGAFDVTTVEGTGPQGWDAELYRNNALIAFATIDERGEYRFEDVELNFGNNLIRVVLYGPQGQTREIVENYSFGSNMLRPGQFDYTIGMLDAEKDLLPFQKRHANGLDGLVANAEMAYGFNCYITGYAAFSSLPVYQDNQQRDYLSVGAAMALPFGALQLEAYQNVSRDSGAARGQALDARFITDIKGIKLNLRNAFYHDFESPDSGFGAAALSRRTEIGLQKNIPFAFGMLGLNLDYQDQQRRNHDRYSNIRTRQSFNYRGLSLTHSTNSYLNAGRHDLTTGQLSATARIKKWRLRSGLNYDAFADKKLRGFDGEVFYRATDRLSGSLLARHDFLDRQSGGGFNLNYDFKKFIGSLETLWTEKSGAQVTLRASTALGPYANDGSYIMTSDRLTGASAARALVFLDRNQDGIFDAGDEALESARVKINSRYGKDRSDENGLLVNRAGAGVERAVIELDNASLENPYYISAKDGYVTNLRPGSIPHFDFPVIETGAVDGTAYAANGQAAQGVRLALVTADGKVVQETETAYDGYYNFDHVPPGQYEVRPHREETIALAPRPVIVDADRLFASGSDLAMIDQRDRDAPLLLAATAPVIAPRTALQVKKVEIIEDPESVRLILDLSGGDSDTASYTAQRSENGRMIYVDLPQVEWRALRAWRGSSDAVLAAYDIEKLAEGGTRLKLSGKRRIAMEDSFQTAETRAGRLTFELIRD